LRGVRGVRGVVPAGAGRVRPEEARRVLRAIRRQERDTSMSLRQRQAVLQMYATEARVPWEADDEFVSMLEEAKRAYVACEIEADELERRVERALKEAG
jgi:SpoVK/Ycf46/Vps4 family AAA+-type ATPase